MARWFRLYDDTLNDPKILKLSDKTHRVWIGILCVASKNEGALPPLEDMALLLRMKPEKLQPELEKLIAAGLIDHDDLGLRPHNWQGRQYKSDVSTDRVKRFRNGNRKVSETPPETEADTETETETEKDSVAKATGAPAPVVPIDARTALFRDGLKSLQALTGKPEAGCRTLVGKWLRDAKDDAKAVHNAIRSAEEVRAADPVPWIERVLRQGDDDEIYRGVL